MRLRILEFAEYAAFTDDKKLIMSGIFNRVGIQRVKNPPPGARIAVPLTGFLVWVLEASISEGLKHTVAIRVVNEDGKKILDTPLGSMDFHLDKQGRPMRFQGRLGIAGMPLPGPGDYEFELYVDGSKVGETSLYVDDVTAGTV